jgi:hypothetical protein
MNHPLVGESGPEVAPRFTFPRLFCKLPPPRAHDLTEQEQQRSAGWCRQHLQSLLPDAAIDTFLAEQLHLLAAYCYPGARADRIALITDAMMLFGAVDNILDSIRSTDRRAPGVQVVIDVILECLRGGRSDAAAGLREIADLLSRVQDGMSAPQRERLIAGIDEYAEGCAAEDRLRAQPITDFHAYMQAHIGASFRGLVLALIEYGLDIDISTSLASSPALRAAGENAIKHALLINDLFSYRKEWYAGNVSMNPITVFIRYGGKTLQQAVDCLCDLILATEAELYDARDAVLASSASDYPHVRTYLQALEEFCAGYIRCCFTIGRYNGAGHHWNGVTHGTMVLYPDRTEYLPA